jgi:hypothetical protein
MVWVLHSKRVADLNVFVSNREPKTIVTQVFWLRETDVGDLDRGERAMHFCISLGLAHKIHRVFGSPVGSCFQDPKPLLRPIYAFACSRWR